MQLFSVFFIKQLLVLKHHAMSNTLSISLCAFLFLEIRSGGRSKIALTFTCDFSSPSFLLQSRSYSASLLIRVVPDPPLAQGIPITWVLPPHYTTSDLLPPYSKSHITTDFQSQTGYVTYSLLGYSGKNVDQLHKGIISISGKSITTTESNNLACIQAKDHSTGRIEVASCVRVAEVLL